MVPVGAYAARYIGRGHAHAAKKRPQRYVNARREVRYHLLFIKGNDAHLRIAKILRDKAAFRPKSIVGVGNGQFDGLDAHLQHVAWLGPFHENRAGEDVPAWSFVGHVFDNVAQGGFYLGGRQACAFQPGWGGGDERVNRHRFARFNAEHGRCGGIVVAPSGGGGRNEQFVLGALGLGNGYNPKQGQQAAGNRKQMMDFHADKFAPNTASGE